MNLIVFLINMDNVYKSKSIWPIRKQLDRRLKGWLDRVATKKNCLNPWLWLTLLPLRDALRLYNISFLTSLWSPVIQAICFKYLCYTLEIITKEKILLNIHFFRSEATLKICLFVSLVYTAKKSHIKIDYVYKYGLLLPKGLAPPLASIIVWATFSGTL